jgi:transcriptional regulator with XRE-family HTH domain
MIENAEGIRGEIGHRIKVRRVDKRLTQKGLAELLGTEQAQVSSWESGRRSLRIEDAMRIAEILDTTVGYLVGEQDRSEARARARAA